MSIVLGANQYGKAENRVVRIYRDTPRHEIRDVNVSTALRGDFRAAHLTGDQTPVLPTDTQKQTVYAYAKEVGIGEIEEYALALGRHFVSDIEPVEGCRIEIDEYAWERVSVGAPDGQPRARSHLGAQGPGDPDHDLDHRRRRPAGGAPGLGLQGPGRAEVDRLGVPRLPGRRVHDPDPDQRPDHGDLAGGSLALHRHRVDWASSYASIKQIMLEQFAQVQSLALQQTLYEMGKAVLEAHDEVAEIKFSAPNKHHFVYDLEPFGLENPNEVFHADDRPYGLIEATVLRDDAPPAGRAWDTVPGFADGTRSSLSKTAHRQAQGTKRSSRARTS